ncbi:MAG: hypothetical protein JXA21_13430 [Anaerolineae bacterium]|nr:hypothetical protein [Anaerolineae bacterium]
MKIVRRDENTLILRPGGGQMIMFGLACAAMALLITWLLGLGHRLTCRREPNRQIQCQLTQTLYGFVVKTEPVNGLQRARLDEHEDDDSTTYQIVLSTTSGEKYVGASSNLNVAQKQRFVENTNTFIQYPNLTNLDIESGEAGWIMWVNALFIVLGIVVIVAGLQAMFTTWTFDRTKGTLVQREETILGVKMYEYALRDIAGAHVASPRSGQSGGISRVELKLRDGTLIPMSSWNNGGYGSKERAARAIREFMQQR